MSKNFKILVLVSRNQVNLARNLIHLLTFFMLEKLHLSAQNREVDRKLLHYFSQGQCGVIVILVAIVDTIKKINILSPYNFLSIDKYENREPVEL